MTEAENDVKEGLDAEPQSDAEQAVGEADQQATDLQAADPQAASEEQTQKLTLDVKVEAPSACERHVTVVVARDDVDRYLAEGFSELAPKAEVPGFRPGRAPLKLIQHRFKDQVNQQVKGKLLMDSLAQISESESFSAINEPDMDFEAVEIPDEGPMTFEFDLEVRPQFDLPDWKGLSLNVVSPEVTDSDVDEHLKRVLRRYAKLVEQDAPAELGDMLTLDLEFSQDGRILSHAEDVSAPLKPKLSLRDALIENFGELLVGAAKGDVRETEVKVSESETVGDQPVQVKIRVRAVERLELPRLTDAFLNEIGGFADEADLRTAVREELVRQNRYRANQQARQQITRELTADANWDLPPALLKRQAQRELRRAVLELQSSGFSEDMIQGHSNQLQRNALGYTAMALKEHFILERIAEEEKIDADEDDFDEEIELIAEQSAMPARRVRARLEKRGEMDSLRNQIIERKVIELITSHATLKEVPAEVRVDDTAAIDVAVSGKQETAEIPEAKHGEEPASPPK